MKNKKGLLWNLWSKHPTYLHIDEKAGMKMCEKHKENAIVCNAVGAHHDEIEMNNMISPIV